MFVVLLIQIILLYQAYITNTDVRIFIMHKIKSRPQV